MDAADVNGGNAENADVTREKTNLEISNMPNLTVSPETMDTNNKAEVQEVNGDLKNSPKKTGSPVVRRKLRKFKANSTSTIETDAPKTKGRKRKLSEIDDVSSEESMEFIGFDSRGTETDTGSHVLKKLIGIKHQKLNKNCRNHNANTI